MFYDQSQFDVRCEWGGNGVRALAADSDVVIIVDVLSFCTCIDIATARGAVVFPYPWKDRSAARFAEERRAVLAGDRSREGFSLSPSSLRTIEPGARLVLPSPNGATLTLLTEGKPTLAGCLRNASAVARAAHEIGQRIAVVPAGERWEDGSLRPAIEDLIGAGAIVRALGSARTYSPEARMAAAAFEAATSEGLHQTLTRCASGRELIERGFAGDVELASEIDVSSCVPIFRDQAYRAAAST
jgi:2-phosphosulfolactate phosphatase